uniref:Uncharacterized protein n=1 Tax=Globodera rostochiensis TaxID=31243 RepID=A0A914HP54_GLORO
MFEDPKNACVHGAKMNFSNILTIALRRQNNIRALISVPSADEPHPIPTSRVTESDATLCICEGLRCLGQITVLIATDVAVCCCCCCCSRTEFALAWKQQAIMINVVVDLPKKNFAALRF